MNDGQSKSEWLLGLTETMPLTPLDFTAPQNYNLKALLFPFPDGDDIKRCAAVAYLRAQLARVLSVHPFLGGQIVHARDNTELPRMVFSSKPGMLNLERYPNEVLDHQVLDHLQFPWDFGQLSAQDVPAASMDKGLLWLLPNSGPGPGDACHPVTIRISFMEDGLVLGFAFHHGVMDGMGTLEFLKCFASDAVAPAGPLQQNKELFIEYATRAKEERPVDPHSMDGYDFNAPSSPPVLPDAVAKIFLFSSVRFRGLQQDALALLRAQHGPNTFVSVTDVVCALTWLHVTRVRLRAGRIRWDDTTRFATAVDIREKVKSALGSTAGYIGNLFLRVLASSTVKDLVQGQDHGTQTDPSTCPVTPATTAQIARAAFLIRTAIQTLNNQHSLQEHIAVAARATDPSDPSLNWPEVDAAVRRAISRHSTGLDVTVGAALGGDVEFDIPGTGGRMKPAWMRRAYVPNEGFMAVLPRRGVTKGDADWEVWLGMREEDMRAIEAEGELGRYLTRAAA